MSRRTFLKKMAAVGLGGPLGLSGSGALAWQDSAIPLASRPIRILMGGYGPPDTSFSTALRRIGERLTSKFNDEVDVKYVYNILDLGYRGEDILWLVETGVLTLGYQSTSYFTERVPEVALADLPFVFRSTAAARAAIDGAFGRALTQRLEARMGYRVLGYFENGFRHLSNKLRPVRVPADMKGMRIRVLPSKVQARTFELLGAEPLVMDLSEAIAGVKAGTLDAQENPFFNTVTYGVHDFHKFHTTTNHFYLSRPIFVHRPSFEAWPEPIQAEMQAAIQDAVAFQRQMHVKEEEDAAATIRNTGGEIVELTTEELATFASAVAPIYGETRRQYDPQLLALMGL